MCESRAPAKENAAIAWGELVGKLSVSQPRGNGGALPPIVHAAHIGSSVAQFVYFNGVASLEWLRPKVQLSGNTARDYQRAREYFVKQLIAAGVPLAEVGNVLAAIDPQAVRP